ncbi:class IIb bacteriocin, lactobin A/cerein 7B family [Streptococcus ruminantium]|uniref:class IIb bacteriocin, lactobin A/cerein 7B family n=1 Tax=Streptococcus ruminantium TaxID=1917441 RepID=UPI001F21A694|nr:class IIb bacteriocin, lactobin A/cerein 7B family [Streptococcus ruminantium]BDD41719.1 hypothetical protein GUT189_00520 [Streptococcus ruminantium]
MTAFETLENNYVTLTEAELVDTEGGIDIAAPIKAIFNVGKEFGRALAAGKRYEIY